MGTNYSNILKDTKILTQALHSMIPHSKRQHVFDKCSNTPQSGYHKSFVTKFSCNEHMLTIATCSQFSVFTVPGWYSHMKTYTTLSRSPPPRHQDSSMMGGCVLFKLYSHQPWKIPLLQIGMRSKELMQYCIRITTIPPQGH